MLSFSIALAVLTAVAPASMAVAGSAGMPAPAETTSREAFVSAQDAPVPEVVFVSAPTKLNDGQSGKAVVHITNRTPDAYRNVVITALDDDDIDISPPDGGPGTRFTPCPADAATSGRPVLACLDLLPPRTSVLLDVRVRAHPQVRTGKQSIGVVMECGRVAAGGEPETPSTFVGVRDVELAVFGVDAISPFGVGTLFVLPGLVAVLLFLLLVRVYPRTSSLPETLDIKDLRILPVVVPPAALVYLTVFLVFGRNLTERVGTSDVAVLFGLGMALGIVVWLVVVFSWYRAIGRRRFKTGDRPVKVLERLCATKGATLKLPRFTIDQDYYFHLAPGPEGKVLATPQLRYEFSAQGDSEQERKARIQFFDAVDNDDIALVLHAVRTGTVTISADGPGHVVAVDPGPADAGSREKAPLLTEREDDPE
uniref:hypothetical protein n=1 Tax=Saccharothrix mutabilis TaxID=33921 RepID=UPI0031E20D43